MAKKSRYTGYADRVNELRQPITINSGKELAEFLNQCDGSMQINIRIENGEIEGGDAFAESKNSRGSVLHE